MRTARVLYSMARADFFERVRRNSFLLTLAGAAFFCYHVHTGNLGIHLNGKRGTMNSAWLGAVMTLVATVFLSWFGFYVVKDAVARDERTGVGQILAATPLSRVQYVFGKALSNFAVLGFMVLVLAFAAPPLQLLAGEDPHLDFRALFAPFLFIAFPAMALVAALAILFESVRWLRGGLGNLLYLFLFNTLLLLAVEGGFIDPTGIKLFEPSMNAALSSVDPSYKGGFGFGAGPHRAQRAFQWNGLEWTPAKAVPGLVWMGISVGLCFGAALCFNRFDSSWIRIKGPGRPTPGPRAEVVSKGRASARARRLSSVANRPSFLFVFANELRIMLKGARWWWYAGAAGGAIAGAAVQPAGMGYALACAWIWPVLLWSGMGGRESRYGTEQFVFSAPHPLRRQLPAMWLAGVAVALALGSGAALRLLARADWTGVGAFAVGALLPPSLAVCLGVWSGGGRVFEVVYSVGWYIGPLSRLPALDFTFTTGNTGLVPAYAMIVAALLMLAVLGRWRAV